MTNAQISMTLFLQIAVILGFCRLLGPLARKAGQPQVMAEMIAGVLLGPSLLGLFWPQASAILFPKETLPVIHSLAQVGLVLYMFIVGLDFRVDIVQKSLKNALSISIAGIAAPFALAALIGIFVVNGEPYFSSSISIFQRVVFLGASMAITAFPMLARIIQELRISNTKMGTIVLAAGSFNDIAAWCFLSVVLATLSHNIWIAVLAIGGGSLFALGALTLGPKLLKKIVGNHNDLEFIHTPRLGLVLALLGLCAWITDGLGVHAVFGSFLLGAVFPRGTTLEHVKHAIEPLTTQLLVPLFFVYSGLNTQIGLVLEPSHLWIAILVVAASCLGKGVSCFWAAKSGGFSTPDSIAIGAFMNARGMMELIILNIGLERGIISPVFFSIMVIMAIVTNFMAMPIFHATRRSFLKKHLRMVS